MLTAITSEKESNDFLGFNLSCRKFGEKLLVKNIDVGRSD